MIGIVDYKAGNSRSVMNACARIGVEAKLVNTKEELKQVDKIILPGVGSAKATMDSLSELDIVDTLTDLVINKKKPFLGICVGLQVLFEHSEEGDVDCLGWLKGQVRKFDATKVRVPQIGWNKVTWEKESPITKGMSEHYFYFVNSYYAVPQNKEDILGQACYEHDFLAFVNHDNIFASQCHIEKSGEIGLHILKNFCEMEDTAC